MVALKLIELRNFLDDLDCFPIHLNHVFKGNRHQVTFFNGQVISFSINHLLNKRLHIVILARLLCHSGH